MPTAQVLFTPMMRLVHTKELAMLHKGQVCLPRIDRIGLQLVLFVTATC